MRILTMLGLTILLLTLTACGSSQTPAPTLDTAIIYTQAAQTVSVQLTQTSAMQTALAPTSTPQPTFTPSPTITPVATLNLFGLPTSTYQPPLGISTPTLFLPPLATPTGPLCNNSAYVSDVGTPDGTILKPGQPFAKGWLIQNTGSCNWKVGYHLVRVGGNTDFGGAAFIIHFPNQVVLAGTITEISLNLVAPKQPGKYEARYQMYTDLEVPFGTGMTVAVEVRK